MTEPTPSRRPGDRLASAAQTILKGIARLVETLGPQPQLQPIPVRARPRAQHRA